MRAVLLLLISLVLWMPAPAWCGPPPLMLATQYEPGVDVPAYWVSEKLDGVRGYWDGRALWTRGGGRIDVPQWFVAGWPAVPMDGELWIGRGRFDDVSALVRAQRRGDPRWRVVRFMVFDLPAEPGGFGARRLRLQARLAATGIPWLQAVPQERFEDARALQVRLDAVVAAGGEGLMLHHREARYRAGRSDALLKLKPHADAEARVVGHTPGRGKYAGMVGALLVERGDGLRFRIGSGLADAQRRTPPPVGSWVTYRYSGYTGKGVPRFARFVRVREDMPPPDPR